MAARKTKPAPRAVLLDTQVFDAHGRDFTRPAFVTLKALVDEGRAAVFITTVIDGEVRAHITADSVKAQRELRASLKENAILRHLPMVPFHQLVKKDALTDLTSVMIEQWETWLADNKVTVIKTDHVRPEELVRMYFRVLPPFAEGKKKSEFPDALTLEAAKDYCQRHNTKLYVITGDKGVQDYCTPVSNLLDCVPTLATFLEKFPDQQLVEALHAAFETKEQVLHTAIANQLRNEFFVLLGAEGQVNDVTATKVKIKSVTIAEAKDGKGVAEIDCEIEYEAEVEWEELNYPNVAFMTFPDSMRATVIVWFSYTDTDPKGITVETVHFDDPFLSIDIEPHINPDPPYMP